MITQHSPRSNAPAWTRYFILISVGITQLMPILVGVSLVSAAMLKDQPFSAGKLVAGSAFLASAASMLYAIYRDWRGGRRLNQNPVLLVAVALLVVGLLVMMPAPK